MQDYGKRVGHGSGLWFFQAGNTTVSHNQIVEGPRDAFGVYGQRFGCFGPKGAGSLTCGADCNGPGVVKKIYGKPCDFWCGLRALTTRHIEISYNKVANVVRDTSDAGALECKRSSSLSVQLSLARLVAIYKRKPLRTERVTSSSG